MPRRIWVSLAPTKICPPARRQRELSRRVGPVPNPELHCVRCAITFMTLPACHKPCGTHAYGMHRRVKAVADACSRLRRCFESGSHILAPEKNRYYLFHNTDPQGTRRVRSQTGGPSERHLCNFGKEPSSKLVSCAPVCMGCLEEAPSTPVHQGRFLERK